MKSLYIPAYAKINLFLEILSKRDDGFHNIESVMQAVSLCDDVTIEINDSAKITLDCPALDIPQEKNIARKAAKLYAERAGITDGIHISIEKKIPWEAGLGGGSSDAGAVLRGLNEIYGAFTADRLCDIAAEIGSDVPFCVRGGCMLAKGRGEILSPLAPMPDCTILIAKGEGGSSTAKAYAAADSQGFIPKENDIIEPLNTGDLYTLSDRLFNRFEDTAPYALPIKDVMTSCGALSSLLSGSGSAVFGIFDDKEKAERAKELLILKGYFAETCVPVNQADV